MGTYTVKPGDSYASIAGDQYGNQRWLQALAEANGGGMLHPGQVINLPDFDTAQSPVVTQQWWDANTGGGGGGQSGGTGKNASTTAHKPSVPQIGAPPVPRFGVQQYLRPIGPQPAPANFNTFGYQAAQAGIRTGAPVSSNPYNTLGSEMDRLNAINGVRQRGGATGSLGGNGRASTSPLYPSGPGVPPQIQGPAGRPFSGARAGVSVVPAPIRPPQSWQQALGQRYGGTAQTSSKPQATAANQQIVDVDPETGMGITRGQIADGARYSGLAIMYAIRSGDRRQLPNLLNQRTVMALPIPPGFGSIEEFLTALGYYFDADGNWRKANPVVNKGYGNGTYAGQTYAMRGGGGGGGGYGSYARGGGYASGGGGGLLVNWRIG